MLAIEKLMGLEVPLRAQYIRVLMAELTRISNHMLNLGSHIMDVGAMTPNLWLFEVREDTLQLYEAVSGARMHANYFRVGGVHQDIPREGAGRHGDLPRQAHAAVRGRDFSLVADNRIFKQRNVDIGTVSKEDALAWGFSGPMIRAAGIPWDLRKSQPYEVYDRMEFDIPVGTTRRLLRPLHGPGRGSAAVGADHAPVPQGHAVGPDRHASTARCSRPSAPR